MRTHLMRRTVHLVTADDVLAWRSRHDAMLRQEGPRHLPPGTDRSGPRRTRRGGGEVMSDGEPRSMGELARAVAGRWPAPGPRALGEMLAAALIPMAQLPPRGLWRTRAGERYCPSPTGWAATSIRRHRPASIRSAGRWCGATSRRSAPPPRRDLRAWCGLAGLPAAVAAVREEMVVFRDERGRELLDLPDAPRPDPGTPAPVRFLPAFDNAILGYHTTAAASSTRAPRAVGRGCRVVWSSTAGAAKWNEDADTVTVAPLRPLAEADRAAVEEGGRALASFLSDGRSDRVRVGASPDA
ncbi:crosslink repair DNA glycosylase YcaQ family protein [Streptomyces sp. SS52]|uniref:DNA glycosylase AlkZ-like family protein n=1 Tax=Streptomyces sp. SS52 TaxID=2563602 RepID=UPI00109E7202|nr:crosslink repair DNA glycosylase YcaQ family protein [Streptomyces sp. SS52]QCB20875.1 winged helix DNA-binding domain-containing protein [Streptomyces sp. SS52]